MLFFMTKKSAPPTLRIVPSPGATSLEPPRLLGEHGRALWDHVVSEYDVSDPAGSALLSQACVMLDRAESLASCVEREGELIRTARSVKTNPAIKDEISCRNSVIRALTKLGLNYEPLRLGPGRPSKF